MSQTYLGLNMFFQMTLLILATLIWGMTFVAQKVVIADFSALSINAIRYLLAALVSLPFFLREKTWKKSKEDVLKPFIAGTFLCGAIYTQTLGLKYTSVAKSSFITCLYAFLVPVYFLFRGKSFPKIFWLLITLALLGVAFLCELRFKNFNLGDMLTFICVVFCSAHIIYISKVANDFKSAFEFNGLQCLFCGLISLLGTLVFENFPSLSPFFCENSLTTFSSLWALFILVIPAGVIAFGIQIYTQKTLAPHIASSIFLLESPFAALFAFFILGERLSSLGFLGALMILLSVGLIGYFESKEPGPPKVGQA